MSNKMISRLLFGLLFVNFAIALRDNTKPAKRAIGGEEVVPNAYPSHIRIEPATARDSCQGVIIHPSWVLTTAGCTQQDKNLKFYAGDFSTIVTEDSEQFRVNKALFRHPNFNPTTFINDIALSQLNEPLTLNDKVQHVQVATERLPLPDAATLVAWGVVNASFTFPETPFETNLPIDKSKNCRKKSLCAGSDDFQKNGCFGDYGGPLYYKVNGQQVLLGVLSSEGCSLDATKQKLSVFVRTSKYIHWIEKQTGLCFEEVGKSGFGNFVTTTTNTKISTDTKVELFSELSDSLCQQFSEFKESGRISKPNKYRSSTNIPWGWFKWNKCGNESCKNGTFTCRKC